MTRCLFQILACVLCLVGQHRSIGAPHPPVEASPDGERFLFVVDMSEDMERMQPEIEATVYDMLAGGIYGQMRSGDTFGIWTFNKETYAGRFPVQIWDSRKSAQLGAIGAAYLSGAPYEKSTDMQQMMSKLMTVIHAVSNLNVFIITDGSTSMRGTPFDKAIDAEYKKRRRERNSAKRPFVTTLIVRSGWVTTNSVTIAGEPIQLPERIVPEPPTRKAVAPALAGVTPAKKIIITTAPAAQASAPVAPKQDPPPATPPSPKIITATQSTNDTVPTVVSAEPIQKPAPSPTPAPLSPAIPDSPADLAPTARQVVTQSNIVAAVANETPPRKPVIPENPPVANITPPTSAAALAAPSKPAPTAKTVVEASPVKPVPEASVAKSALAAILPEPIPVAAREPNATQTQPEPEPLTPIQGAALPMQGSGNAMWLFAFGGFLLASAFFLAFVVIRRARPAAEASLITQSMNRR